MAEACKYCEVDLSTMDIVYIESEVRTAPKKVQNLIATHRNMVCYNCFKRFKNMKIVNVPDKEKRDKI